MTEAGTGAQSDSSDYMQAWAQSFAQVLQQISGAVMPGVILAEAPADLAPVAESDLWVICAGSGGIRGEMSLRLAAPAILRLAQIFMSEPAAPNAELTSQHREAAMGLLRQVAGLVATSIKPRWGEVQLRLDPTPSAPSWSASSTLWLRLGDDTNLLALIELQVSAALWAALRAERSEAPKYTSSGASPGTASSSDGPESKVKLDLLLDVELAVTLRFGSRQMLLREVLDLQPGAVVDLDRQVKDPVDVLLDGRLLARGEVVVLNGNYGLRVTEVAPAGPV
jgi:flagellar motor switch protein FliN